MCSSKKLFKNFTISNLLIYRSIINNVECKYFNVQLELEKKIDFEKAFKYAAIRPVLLILRVIPNQISHVCIRRFMGWL